jgi:hypothetical protein
LTEIGLFQYIQPTKFGHLDFRFSLNNIRIW